MSTSPECNIVLQNIENSFDFALNIVETRAHSLENQLDILADSLLNRVTVNHCFSFSNAKFSYLNFGRVPINSFLSVADFSISLWPDLINRPKMHRNSQRMLINDICSLFPILKPYAFLLPDLTSRNINDIYTVLFRNGILYTFGKHSNGQKFEQSLMIQDKNSLAEYAIDKVHADMAADDDIVVLYSIMYPILIFDLHSKSFTTIVGVKYDLLVKIFINDKHLIIVHPDKYCFYDKTLIKLGLGSEFSPKLEYEFINKIQSHDISFNNSFFIIDLKISCTTDILEFWIISLMGVCEHRSIKLETTREFRMYNYRDRARVVFKYIVEDNTISYFRQIDAPSSKINFIKIEFQ